MSRIAQFLAGVTVVAAATANVNCTATACSTCVGTGVAQVCANYQVPPAPTCVTCGGLAGANLCSAATSATATCSVCVSVLSTALGVCLQTTANIAPYLTANSTLSAGLDLSAFVSGATLIQGDVSASGSVDVPAGNAVVVLGATPIATLNANTNTNNNIFQINSSLAVGAWNSAGTAQVNNNNNVELKVNSLMVGASSSSSSKFAVAQEQTASVSFQSINFGGSGGELQVAGGSAHFGANAAVSGNITGSGQVQLSNGVSVDGNLPASVTVSVDSSGTNAPLITIDSGATFNVSGNVITTKNGDTQLTANADAVIAVSGVFVAATASANARVEPKVILKSGSSFVINNAQAFEAKAVAIGAGAALVIDTNANRAALKIKQIAECAGKVQIRLAVTAEAFIASSASSTAAGGTGSVAFSYDNTNNVNELVKCGVEVYDSSNRKYTLTSRTSTQAAAGRRLLASDGSATWGDDSMTFQMEKQTSAAPVSFAVVPLLMVSMAGLLF